MKRAAILSVASEVYPLIKTGGLADVAGALPAALAPQGFAVRTLVPGYPSVLAALKRGQEAARFDLFGGEARLVAGKAKGLDLLVLDAPHLYDRPGNPYSGPDGADWHDNPFRFAALGKVAAEVGRGLVPGYRPDVIHCHDWQAGLAPAYLQWGGEGPRPATVITVHNLAFQGGFPAGLLGALGFPAEAFTVDGIEYHGQIGYLKAGLRLADRITTVSPTYAAEICTDDFGMGLQGLLRGRGDVLRGILNGIDTSVWNPATDALIGARYDAATLDARAANKEALQGKLGLAPDAAAPVFGVISRLGWQKGLDLLLAALPVLLAEGGQLALLGAGDPGLEDAYRRAAAEHPGRIGCIIGYDESLAHLIQAGSDALLVPSRFEPCGLTQLCALRYGAVPVVARVGGLADTIVDANPVGLAAGTATGFQFSPVNEAMLESAIRRASRLYRNPAAWRALQQSGMATDVSWSGPAADYAALYRELIPQSGSRRRK